MPSISALDRRLSFQVARRAHVLRVRRDRLEAHSGDIGIALRLGIELRGGVADRRVRHAHAAVEPRAAAEAGAALLDFRHSGLLASSTSSEVLRPPWNSAKTATPASASDLTTEAEASTLISCAPPSSTSRRAFCAVAKRGGRSQERSACFTPRRTALHTTSISSSVISPSFSPQRLTPTESPTETSSTPARSTIWAIW